MKESVEKIFNELSQGRAEIPYSEIAKYLQNSGYGGLFSSEGECACENDDLFPCGEMPADCEAGYKIPCSCNDVDFKISRTGEPCELCSNNDLDDPQEMSPEAQGIGKELDEKVD